ncbi:hypothetical protein MY3296_009335 [Beauveria thailandica]
MRSCDKSILGAKDTHNLRDKSSSYSLDLLSVRIPRAVAHHLAQ